MKRKVLPVFPLVNWTVGAGYSRHPSADAQTVVNSKTSWPRGVSSGISTRRERAGENLYPQVMIFRLIRIVARKVPLLLCGSSKQVTSIWRGLGSHGSFLKTASFAFDIVPYSCGFSRRWRKLAKVESFRENTPSSFPRVILSDVLNFAPLSSSTQVGVAKTTPVVTLS